VEAISDYVGGDLTPSRCRQLEAHLANCPCCDRFAGSLRHAIQVCKAAGQTRLPASVQRRARERITSLLDALPAPARRGRAAAR
jgi:RNA polymerase sigma-70 factor (ECF subfamily)